MTLTSPSPFFDFSAVSALPELLSKRDGWLARHHGRGTDGRTGWGEGSRACELEQLRNISRQLARLVGWLLKRLKPFFLPHPPSLFLFVPSSCVIYCGVLSAAAAALAAEAFVLTTSCSTYSVVRATCAALEEGGGQEGGGRTNSLGQEFRTYYARIPNCLASPAADPTPPPPRVNGRASG